MDHKGDYTPYLAGVSFGHVDVGIIGTLGLQGDVLAGFDQSFHGQLIVDDRDHHFAADRLKGTIHHEDIVMVNTRSNHGVTSYPNKEGSGRVGHHKFIEVESSLNVVVCWARESSRYATGKKRAF